MTITLEKLRAAQARTGSLLSIGLEPCPEYLAHGMTADVSGYKAFMRMIISATHDLTCAYKLNIAFFEALQKKGWELLYEIREMIPADTLIIADAKRSDIGSSAQRYAFAFYDQLQVDSITVNPLMGRDSVQPFLEYRDKLNFFLCLTSNPGASDFLMRNNLYRDIAQSFEEWNAAENCGLVVGATKPEYVSEIRALAPSLPFLIPGIGAQGGDIARVAENGRMCPDFSGMIFHVTRGILPARDEEGHPRDIIRRKAIEWRDRVNTAYQASTS